MPLKCSMIALCTQLSRIVGYDYLKIARVRPEMSLSNLSRSTGLWVLLVCTGFLIPSQARGFDLDGAWATGADQCSKVFVKKGDQISFAQFSEEFGGGFIANGNEVRSKTSRCNIRSRRETGDTIEFQAACASEIMATSVHLSLKILNDNSLSRVFTDPNMEGMQLTFYRCGM